jgi:hypothetical protein
MQIVEQSEIIKTDSNMSTKQFGFVFNAKMVQLLSDSLYKDKILAIIRELSTNAFDSHVEACKQDFPFDVHLPTNREPFFSIRDYGTGMSPERINNIYCYYGGSDRCESNNFVGGMGLGSKSPFCYHTRKFFITSWYNNIEYKYVAYIGENGIPHLSQLSKQISNQPNGVRILFGVLEKDIDEFFYKAGLIYQYFNVTPNFIGRECVIEKVNYQLIDENKQWGLRNLSGANDRDRRLRVIMGHIAYPVDFYDDTFNNFRNILNQPFDIFAQIGEISIDIGRERLSFDNKTKTRLRYYINQIHNSFAATIEKEINNCSTLWDARLTFYEKRASAVFHSIVKCNDIKYKTQPLFDDGKDNIDVSSISNGILRVGGSLKNYKTTRNITLVYPKRYYKFYERDITLGSIVRAAYIAEKEKTLVHLINSNVLEDFLCLTGMNRDNIPKISSVPSPTVRSRQKSNVYSRVVQFTQKYDIKNSYWCNADINFNNYNGTYVNINRYNIHYDQKVITPQHFIRILRNFNDMFKIPCIIGIRNKDLNKVKHITNTIDLLKDMVIKKANEISNNCCNTSVRDIIDSSYWFGRYWPGSPYMNFGHLLAVRNCCTKTTQLLEQINELNEIKTIIDTKINIVDCRTIVDFCSTFNIKLGNGQKIIENKMQALNNLIEQKYCFLKHVNFNNAAVVKSIAKCVDALTKGEKE